jgi:hypothetical protein
MNQRMPLAPCRMGEPISVSRYIGEDSPSEAVMRRAFELTWNGGRDGEGHSPSSN